MKNIFTLLFAILWIAGYSQQDYKITHNTGQIKIYDVDEVNITAYDGNEIIISSPSSKSGHKDERAAGLKRFNSAGLDDNTGMGVFVEKDGEDVTVQQITSNCDCKISVKLPRNMGVYYTHGTYNGDDITIDGVGGEIEISATYNNLKLKNVTGPMAVKSVYGSIDAEFSSLSQTGSISLNSVYDHVDVSFPSASTYNVNIRTPYGDIFSDVDIKVEEKSGMKRISSTRVNGKVNGGGVDVTLKSNYDSVYLRKN